MLFRSAQSTAENQTRRNELVFPSVGRFQPPVRALSSTSCEPSVAIGFQHNGLSPPTHTQHMPLTNFPGSLPRPLLYELRFLVSLQAAQSSHSRDDTRRLSAFLRVRSHSICVSCPAPSQATKWLHETHAFRAVFLCFRVLLTRWIPNPPAPDRNQGFLSAALKTGT